MNQGLQYQMEEVPSEPVDGECMLSTEETPLARAAWIWLAGESQGDSYVCFRRRFTLSNAASDGLLDLSADTDFVAYLNGREIGRGQFSDFPRRKTWSRIRISAEAFEQENVLAVIVHYRGRDAFDHQKGKAGLIAGLRLDDFELVSDSYWIARKHPAFRSGYGEPMTMQTGLTFLFDARTDEPRWTEAVYNDSAWKEAAVVQAAPTGGYWEKLSSRPLPSLTLGELPDVRVRSQGAVIRGAARESVAAEMMSSALRTERPWFVFENRRLDPSFPGSEVPDGDIAEASGNGYGGAPVNAGEFLSKDSAEPLRIRPALSQADGTFLIIDLGVETVGLLEFEVDAPDGAVLHIAHGEHLDDGRVRAKVGQRHFADQYICRQGRQFFQMPFRRLAARYLEIHCFASGAVSFHSFGLRPVSYPAERAGRFSVEDPLAMRVHDTALRTLELCRHEHYEDCPWREQALYAYDSRLQALYGYHAFADYRFAEVSFSLLHETQRENGFLGLIAPGDFPMTIPSFSFAWVAAVSEHWLYSGRGTLFHKVRATLEKLIRAVLALRNPENGLYHLPEGEEFWHFYEWTPGLAGGPSATAATVYHAAYHFHWHEALRCFIWLLRQSGEEELANDYEAHLLELGNAIHQQFWNEDEGIYATVIEKNKRRGAHELIQALALHENIVPQRIRPRLISRLLNGGLRPATLSASYYFIIPMLNHNEASRQWLFRRLGRIYEEMIFAGATSLWETAAGGDDFDHAGSLCHGWSAMPIYLHQAVVLGIAPLDIGFRRFSVRIWPSRFASAEGTMPTPFGMISIRWFKERAGLFLNLTIPEECQPVLLPFPEAPYAEVTVNGRKLKI